MLIWWRGQGPLGPAEEFSCTALSSSPPSILELRHRPCPTARTPSPQRQVEDVALCFITLAAGLFGGGVYSVFYTWFDPQKTSYGFGYSSPNSLAGLIHALREDPSFSSVFGGSICRWAAWWSPSSIWSGGHLRHQVLILGGAIHQTHLHEMQRLGIRKAQVAAILVQAMAGTGGSKSWPMATPTGKYAGRFVLLKWRWR